MEAYKKGFIDALKAFAWWKDGVEYVGDGHYTLKKAIDEIETNWNWDPIDDPLPDSIQSNNVNERDRQHIKYRAN